MHKPAAYWRSTQQWKKLLGKKGVVIASTVIYVTAPQLKEFAPYSYLILEVEGRRVECLGADYQTFQAGDHVMCVLRKMAIPSKEQLIPYGIKATKIT
jgi:uncharacterized OB-fold protein